MCRSCFGGVPCQNGVGVIGENRGYNRSLIGCGILKCTGKVIVPQRLDARQFFRCFLLQVPVSRSIHQTDQRRACAAQVFGILPGKAGLGLACGQGGGNDQEGHEGQSESIGDHGVVFLSMERSKVAFASSNGGTIRSVFNVLKTNSWVATRYQRRAVTR